MNNLYKLYILDLGSGFYILPWGTSSFLMWNCTFKAWLVTFASHQQAQLRSE